MRYNNNNYYYYYCYYYYCYYFYYYCWDTHKRFRSKIEHFSHTYIKMFSIWIWILEPTRSMKIDIFDQERVECIHIPDKDLIVLKHSHCMTHVHNFRCCVVIKYKNTSIQNITQLILPSPQHLPPPLPQQQQQCQQQLLYHLTTTFNLPWVGGKRDGEGGLCEVE